jgi:hypothetical protein
MTISIKEWRPPRAFHASQPKDEIVPSKMSGTMTRQKVKLFLGNAVFQSSMDSANGVGARSAYAALLSRANAKPLHWDGRIRGGRRGDRRNPRKFRHSGIAKIRNICYIGSVVKNESGLREPRRAAARKKAVRHFFYFFTCNPLKSPDSEK